MKRAPGEDFDAYRHRRKTGNLLTKLRGLKAKLFHTGGTYRKEPVVFGPKRIVVSAAIGKRYKGE